MNSPRPTQQKTFWPRLFPITYVLHVGEEFLGGGGYSFYLENLRGIHLSPTTLLMSQGIGLVLMVVGVILSRRLNFPNLFCVILGSVVLVNCLTHAVQTLCHRAYVPGLVTAILIWLPLGIVTLLHFKDSMSKRRFGIGVAIGIAINLVVEVLIISGG
ncbi:MAG: HXXEE domain-containing protein [Pyrinomonadaceae bacterium]